VFLPFLAVQSTGAFAERAVNAKAEKLQPTDYIDVMVVAFLSPQGIASTIPGLPRWPPQDVVNRSE
jgi:hypothetical protein